jgi:AcrR family transcriptional regulator
VQRRGYEGLRYADLSEELGIRRASIHHHFPRKRDLARAVITSYTARMQRQLDDIDRSSDDALVRLERYRRRPHPGERPAHAGLAPGALLMARFQASPAFLDATMHALREWLTRAETAD